MKKSGGLGWGGSCDKGVLPLLSWTVRGVEAQAEEMFSAVLPEVLVMFE